MILTDQLSIVFSFFLSFFLSFSHPHTWYDMMTTTPSVIFFIQSYHTFSTYIYSTLLFIVFRTNKAYQRWDEARKNWGMNMYVLIGKWEVCIAGENEIKKDFFGFVSFYSIFCCPTFSLLWEKRERRRPVCLFLFRPFVISSTVPVLYIYIYISK